MLHDDTPIRRCPKARTRKKNRPVRHEPHEWVAGEYLAVGDEGFLAICPGWSLRPRPPMTDDDTLRVRNGGLMQTMNMTKNAMESLMRDAWLAGTPATVDDFYEAAVPTINRWLADGDTIVAVIDLVTPDGNGEQGQWKFFSTDQPDQIASGPNEVIYGTYSGEGF